MAGWRPAVEFSKPAPFPVYAGNPQSRLLKFAVKLLAVLLILSCQPPKHAGPYNPLTLPVRYARVELGAREPVVLELDLPAGDWQVAPTSLGYFVSSAEFIYTGDVARGVIFGQPGDEVILVEISAPPNTELYFEDHLSRIRAGVIEVNRRKNLLRQARENVPPRKLFQLGDWGAGGVSLSELLGPDLMGPGSTWRQAVADLGPAEQTKLTAALSSDARSLGLLKQLYYSSQEARLELMLEQYDLQLALAGLPRQEFTELLSLGDNRLVRETMLGEIDRLELAWHQRQVVLNRVLNTSRQWLERNLVVEIEPETGLPANTNRPTYYAPPVESTPGLKLTDSMLAEGLLTARTVVAQAELDALEAGLSKLTTARQHVAEGRLPDWTKLPRIAPEPELLGPEYFAALPLYAEVDTAARQAEGLMPALIGLAELFEGREVNPALLPERGARPDELAYGLILIDGGLRHNPPREARQFKAELTDVLNEPAEFNLAGRELGYLRLMRWYAGLDEPAT